MGEPWPTRVANPVGRLDLAERLLAAGREVEQLLGGVWQ